MTQNRLPVTRNSLSWTTHRKHYCSSSRSNVRWRFGPAVVATVVAVAPAAVQAPVHTDVPVAPAAAPAAATMGVPVGTHEAYGKTAEDGLTREMVIGMLKQWHKKADFAELGITRDTTRDALMPMLWRHANAKEAPGGETTDTTFRADMAGALGVSKRVHRRWTGSAWTGERPEDPKRAAKREAKAHDIRHEYTDWQRHRRAKAQVQGEEYDILTMSNDTSHNPEKTKKSGGGGGGSVTLLGPGRLAPIQPPCLPLKRAVGTQTLAHPHPALIHASISVIERFARAYLQTSDAGVDATEDTIQPRIEVKVVIARHAAQLSIDCHHDLVR
eukprot:COSAG06_NODE_6436_length_2934_cov_4.263845_4_plen_329_part_00